MDRVSKIVGLLLLLGLGAAAQTPPAPAVGTPGQDSPGLRTKDLPNHNGGLVTYYSGNRLTDDQSQTAINVLFDRDSGVIKRSGQQLYGTISGCTSQVRSAGNYLSPAGNAYLFEACGNHIYVSAGDGNFAVIGGTISSTANVYMKQGLGAEWITDGVDALWSTNGVTVSSYAAAPLAQYVGIFQGRVALGNVNGAVSEIYLSGYNNGGDYTLPAVIVDTSPAIFGLNGLNDGRTVTCVSDGYRDVLILWNRDEMYGLYGSGNSSFILRKLAEIGCDEQESVQEFDGKLRWLSQYGIYQYDGLNTQRISDPIKDQILNIVASEPGSLSLTQNSLADWQAGNLVASGARASMSSTILLGSVVPSTSAFVDNTTATFTTGSLVNLSTYNATTMALSLTTNTIANSNFAGGTGWNNVKPSNPVKTGFASNGASVSACATTVTIVCPNAAATCAYMVNSCSSAGRFPLYLEILNGATGGSLGLNSSGTSAGGPLTPTVSLTALNTSTSVFFCFGSQSDTCINATVGGEILETATTPIGFNVLYDINTDLQGPIALSEFANVRVSSYQASGTYTSPTFDTTFSTPVMGAVSLGFSSTTVATLTVQQENSTDGASWSSPATLTNGTTATGGKRYWRYLENFATTSGTITATSNGLNTLGASTTGYMITSCFSVAPITSWGNFQSLNNPGNGAVSYAVSTGTTCDAVQRATATWTAQSVNTTIGVSTASFIGVRVLFDSFSTFYSTNQPTLNSITINWNSAAGRPRMATQVFDNRYWLAFTTNTASGAYNNNVLVYDSMGHWSQFQGINASSLATYKRVLYAGSSLSDGKVIIENTGNNDLGSPILFDFRTPDYELDAFNTVDLYDLNMEFGAVSAAYSPAMTVQYYADHQPTAYSLGTVPLTVGTKGLIYSTERFGASTLSPMKVHTVSFEIQDNTTTPITFYRSMLRYTPEDGP